MTSEANPANDPYVCKVAPIEEPAVLTGHAMKYRYAKTGTPAMDLTAQLRQGYTSEGSQGTLIASATHTGISTTVTDGTISLTTTEADNIVYTSGRADNLYLRFLANQQAATTVTLNSATPLETTTNSTTYDVVTGYTYTNGNLYILLAYAHDAGGAANAGSVAGTSQTWTRISDDGSAVSGSQATFAYRFKPSSTLTNATTTWTADSSVQHEGFQSVMVEIGGAYNTTGTNGSGAIGGVDEKNPGSGTSLTLGITPASNSLVIGMVSHAADETSTATGGYSAITGGNQRGTNPNRGSIAIYDDTTPGGSPGASWTTSASCRGIGIEILHS